MATETAASLPDSEPSALGKPEAPGSSDAVSAVKKEDGEGGDDMFTDSPVRPILEYNGDAKQGGAVAERADDGTGEVNRVDYEAGFTNADNWDDAEGYFRTRPGELIIGRYLVNRDIGAGVYSTVVSATDQKNAGQEVAIKIVVRACTLVRMAVFCAWFCVVLCAVCCLLHALLLAFLCSVCDLLCGARP